MTAHPVGRSWPVLACLAWLCTACFAPDALDNPNLLRIGQTGEPDSLDPHMAVTGPAVVVVNDLFEGLLTLDAAGEVRPGAAAHYEVSPDATLYTFTLRENLRWSNGESIDAEDFVYAFRRMADPQTAGTALAVNIDLVRHGRAVLQGERSPKDLGVRALDRRTLEVQLEHPAPYFPSILATAAFAPVPRQVIETHGRLWTRPGTLVSNGPFRLVDWRSNSYVRVERNPWFHDADSVALDGVLYTPVIDLNTGFRQFQAGEIDTLTNFPAEKIDLLRSRMPDTVRLTPSLGKTAYLFNHRLEKFQDLRVRRALAMALDLPRICELILRTGDSPAYGLVPTGLPGYPPALEPAWANQPHDERLVTARHLLAAAGYDESRPLEFELLFQNSSEHRKVAIAAASMWQAIGVKVRLRGGDRQVVDAAARRGEFEMVRFALFAGFPDPAGFFSAVRSDSPVNGTGYANAELDTLFAQAATQADSERRSALLREAEKVAINDQALLPVYFYTSRRLVSARVRGWPEENLTALRPARYLALEFDD